MKERRSSEYRRKRVSLLLSLKLKFNYPDQIMSLSIIVAQSHILSTGWVMMGMYAINSLSLFFFSPIYFYSMKNMITVEKHAKFVCENSNRY